MKKQVMMWILAVSVVIFPGVSTVRADVLYFDDIITGVGDEIVPNGYGGFSWTDVSNRSFYGHGRNVGCPTSPVQIRT